MNASVVVPTRDRPAALQRCLAAVREQRGVSLEVVVVDDGSREREAVAAVADAFTARLVRLEGVGPAAARNAGAVEARAGIVLLLDDDCVARAGWAERLTSEVTSDSTRVAAGAVFLPQGANIWLRASERLAIRAELSSRLFRTINLACRTEVLLELPFDESFPSAAGEDRDWCVRAERAGLSFARVPEAAVEHQATLRTWSFLRQQARYGRAVQLLRRRGTHTRIPGDALLGDLLAGFRENPFLGLAMAAAHGATAAGYILEWGSRATR